MKKKFLSLVLTLFLVLALAPTAVAAAVHPILDDPDMPELSFEVEFVLEGIVYGYAYALFSHEPISIERGQRDMFDDGGGHGDEHWYSDVHYDLYTFPVGTRVTVLLAGEDNFFQRIIVAETLQFGEVFEEGVTLAYTVRDEIYGWYTPVWRTAAEWELTADYAGKDLALFAHTSRFALREPGHGMLGGRFPISLNLQLFIRVAEGETDAGLTPAPNLNTASTWAHEGITNAIAAGLVPQHLQSNYTQPTTRAEFTALAVAVYERVRGEITGRTTFADTEDVNVQKMAYIGVVGGVGDNRFAPNETLTREQAAVMLSRLSDAIGQPFPTEASAFADNNNASSWALASIGRVQAAGLMSGTGNNMFSPQQSFAREQSIVTFLRLYNMAQ
jgi:hypothetical protein